MTRLRSGRPRLIPPAQEGALQTQVVAHADLTLARHCALWQQTSGVVVGTSTMHRTVRRLGIMLKKDADRP